MLCCSNRLGILEVMDVKREPNPERMIRIEISTKYAGTKHWKGIELPEQMAIPPIYAMKIKEFLNEFQAKIEADEILRANQPVGNLPSTFTLTIKARLAPNLKDPS